MSGWSAISNELLLDHNVSDGAIRLALVLDAVCRQKPSCELSSGELSTAMGCSDREVRRRVAELVDLGWLAVDVRRGRGKVNSYALLKRPLYRTKRASLPGSIPASPVRYLRVASNRNHAGEEEQAGAAAPAPRRPWCGCCEDEYSRGSYVDGRFVKCPRCHPASTAPAPF